MAENTNVRVSDLKSDLEDWVRKAISEAIKNELNHNDNPDLLTEKEAAKYLQVKPQTLASWRHRGDKGPVYTRVGSAIRYDRRDLDAYVEARRVR